MQTCKYLSLLIPNLFQALILNREFKKEGIVEEAERRLNILVNTNFKAIAEELQSHDNYLFHKAYTWGMQEFVEAVFCQFLKRDNISTWNDINNSFQYEENGKKFDLMFSQYDFIFGIADFTGELMRRCINSLGIGNIDDCFKICHFVRQINTGFLGNKKVYLIQLFLFIYFHK